MLNVLVALIPLTLALVLLTIFQQNSRVVGLITLGSAVVLSSIFPAFHLSPFRIALSLGTGVAGSLTLLTILLPAIILYQIQRVDGTMSILIEGISRITSDLDLQIMLLVFGLAPFLDAICGVNVGIFVIAPILLSLRISPIRVACLCAISQVTSVWGTMGVVTLLVSDTTGVPVAIIGSNDAILLMPATLCLCITALLVCGRSPRETLRAWLPVVGTAIILTGGAWIVVRLTGVELAGMLTDLVIIAFMALLGRVRASRRAQRQFSRREARGSFTRLQLWKAALPYTLLTIFLFLSRVITPFADWLQSHAVLSVPQIALNLPILYLPGLWLLVMAGLTVALGQLRINQIGQALAIAWKQFAASALAIISFLAAAQTMQASGMIATFGGVAAVLGTQYVWVSPWLGAMSGWATGSVISGNSLFAVLQKSIAQRSGLSVPWIVAVQNTTSSLGKILSPTSAIIATSASGIPGQEGLVLRKVGLPALLSLVLIMALLGFVTGHLIGAATLSIVLIVALLLFSVFTQRTRQTSAVQEVVMSTQLSDKSSLDMERLAGVQMGRQSQKLIALLEEAPQGMSRSKLCIALGQPANVVHRLLQNLQAQDYVQREGSGLYLLKNAAVTREAPEKREKIDNITRLYQEKATPAPLAAQAQDEAIPWKSLLPYIGSLTERLQEVVYLAVLREGKVVPVAVTKPERLLRLAIEVGCPLPLFSSSCSKVLLAYQQESVRVALAQTSALDHIKVNREQMALEMQLVRHRGYAIDDEEMEEGVRSFAVPMHDGRGALLAALAISGPSSRLPLRWRGSIIEDLRSTSTAMTEMLCGAKAN